MSASKNKYSCDCNVVHGEAVKAVLSLMPDGDAFSRVSVFFKMLADETRAKIIWALDKRELCVCDIANVLSMTKSAVSHQLGVLRRANLVKFRRDGKNVFYSVTDEHVRGMIESGFAHIHE